MSLFLYQKKIIFEEKSAVLIIKYRNDSEIVSEGHQIRVLASLICDEEKKKRKEE